MTQIQELSELPQELPADNQKWIGAAIKAKEDFRFLKGGGSYVDDLKLPLMTYAAILRAPYANAKINFIDTSVALRQPGVFGVITGSDVQDSSFAIQHRAQPPGNMLNDYCIAIEKTHYVGEPVAVIAAESPAIAEDALDWINVSYSPMAAVNSADNALRVDSPLVHESIGTNVIWKDVFEYGDISSAFQEADQIISDRIYFHRFSSVPLETNCIIADFDPTSKNLTVFSNNHEPSFCLPLVAKALGMKQIKIRLIMPDIGGGFGIKINNYVYAILISLLSIKISRPVKWSESRSEHLLASAHGNERTYDVKVAIRKDGLILGLESKVLDDLGAYPRYEPRSGINWLQCPTGCYGFKNLKIDFFQLLTNKCPAGANRGYGRVQHQFMLERVIDLIAKRLKRDPYQIRLKNYIKSEDMPYTTCAGSIYDSGNYLEALKRSLKLINYERIKMDQSLQRRQGRYIGVGVSSTLDPGTTNSAMIKLAYPDIASSGTTEAAMIRIDEQGQISASFGNVSQGHSYETTVAQVIAQELGVSPEDVEVRRGFDSFSTPFTNHSGTYASRSVVAGLGAILGATKIIRNKVFLIASRKLESSPQDLDIHGGQIYVRNGSTSISLSEIARIAWRDMDSLPPEMEPGLFAFHIYRSHFGPTDTVHKIGRLAVTYSYQVHAAAVEVDVETGHIKILNYAIVDDCGRAINPNIVLGQVHGAAAHGIAASLFEIFRYDKDGNLLSSNFMDYFVPSATDLPDIEVEQMETPSPFTPYGVKGVGEGGGGPLSAIVAAVEDALGGFDIRLSSSYQDPEKIFKKICRMKS
jgi:CO/xanthine dehydrogenase Mo-binding subunit